MTNLTDRQQQVLDFIEECIGGRGYPPTLREIGLRLDIKSTNGVNDHLKALEKKGYLKRGTMKSRALCPTTSSQFLEVPLLGQVPAGQPLQAMENMESMLKVDRSLLSTEQDVFALRVKGDSMIEDGILDGDILFVGHGLEARRGDTVVAMVGEEATVKRFYPEGDRIRLQPANSAMAPIYVDRSGARELTIAGVVVGVYRKVK